MATRVTNTSNWRFGAPDYITYARIVRGGAFYAAVAFSALSTIAFAAIAVRPQSPMAWLTTIGIALGVETLLHALKIGLRDDPRWIVGWVALLVDAATNAGGVYLIAPDITTAPGFNLLLISLGADASHPFTALIVCLAIGIMLSIAPAALVERGDSNGGI